MKDAPPQSLRPAAGWRAVAAALVATLVATLNVGCSTVTTTPAGTTAHNQADEVLLRAPEAASGYREQPAVLAKHFMVSAAHPLASEVGYKVLKTGGSAIDAAIAVQMVLNLVEPQSSGIGGGAFLMHFDGTKVQAFDGRETAPALASQALFQVDGKPMQFFEAAVGGRAVGAPGLLRMLELAHQQHGKLPWAALFAPAIELADNGFLVSERLALQLQKEQHLKKDPTAAAYFFDQHGNPWPAGHLLKNPMLAATLRAIAAGGADAFHHGAIARDIVAKINQHSTNPGVLSSADLAGYRARERDPLCSEYRVWVVCGMPPPSSGGFTVAQMLGILETKDLAAIAPTDGEVDPQAVHLFSEAGRLAYADRNRYIADPDFSTSSSLLVSLLDQPYLRERAKLIGERSMGVAVAGTPLPVDAVTHGSDNALELPSTSHLSIVDGAGNAVSMTSTIEDAFGSRQMVRGFLLNNQLTDFSFDAHDTDGPIANRVQGGKRPRSSMAPTLVFEKEGGKLVLVIGSPGGSAIINYVAKTLIGVMDWDLNVQQAINLPNFGSRNGPTELEQGRMAPSLHSALRRRGHTVHVMEHTSGLYGIMRVHANGTSMWLGGADPRREGVARGD